MLPAVEYVLFFFNDTATTEIYTLSLHDALPICSGEVGLALSGHDVPAYLERMDFFRIFGDRVRTNVDVAALEERSEEHTSELQSRQYLVCRLLLEKKKTTINKSSCAVLNVRSTL